MATLSAPQQALVDTLPASGEIDFDAWRKQLLQSDQVELLDAHYHKMRRSGAIKVELRENADGILTSYISRPVVAAPTTPPQA